MFVRWKRRPMVGIGQTLLIASLVRSVRIDGKPRQRVVAYLGSISEYHAQLPWCQRYFWKQVESRLSRVADTDREKVERSILAVIPRPTAEESAVAASPGTGRDHGEVVPTKVSNGGPLWALRKGGASQ